MRTTTYERILQRVCALMGIPRDDLQADEEAIIREHASTALKEIWHMGSWPFCTTTEARTPSSNIIAWEQAGEAKIDTAIAVYDKDPYGTSEAARVPFIPTGDGILLVGTGSTADVYVTYRRYPPDLYGDEYSSTAAYAADGQAYYSTTGDFYRAKQSTTGNAPTDTTYWERLTIPYDFQDYVAHAAYANWLRSEGQDQKAAMQAATSAERILFSEADKLERQQGVLPPLRIRTHSTEYPA